MIVSKTPFRISFLGGGSDFKNFYDQTDGAVLCSSINKYMYISFQKKFDSKIRFSYSQTENVDSIDDLKHPLLRETMRYFNVKDSIEIATLADIPSYGSGLGSSSSFTVGAVNVLSNYIGLDLSRDEIAEIACKIEIDLCGQPIGKQDQYAAAIGGFNFIRFSNNEVVNVEKIRLNLDSLKKIQNDLIIFFTGITRKSSSILKDQNSSIISNKKVFSNLKKMVKATVNLKNELNDNNIDNFGYYLDENWKLKKELHSSISNSSIDDIYDIGISSGALGGKLLGAGAGGFILFYAPKIYHDQIEKNLNFLKKIDIEFEDNGTTLIKV